MLASFGNGRFGWGLTSHSAIFQLYSDKTVVKLPNLDLLPATQRYGQLGVYPDKGTGTSEDVFYLLAIIGPTCGEGMLGIEPRSPNPQSSPLPLHEKFDGLLWCTTISWFEYTAKQILQTLIVKTWPDVSCFDELVFIWVIQALQNVYNDFIQVPCNTPLHYLSKCKKVFIQSCLLLAKLIRIIIWSSFFVIFIQ